MDKDKNIEKTLSIVASNFLSASEIVTDARLARNERSQVLHKSDLDNAIVLAETAIETLKDYLTALID